MKRTDRNFERATRAGRQSRKQGLDAMEAAKAMIETAFDRTAMHVDFKSKIAEVLAKGVAHPANKLRYRARARMLRGESLEGAITAVGRWHRAECQAFQIASIMGRPPALSLIILTELRLILRFFRRKGMGDQFPQLIEALCGPAARAALSTAAE
jgi:hypothetical protein